MRILLTMLFLAAMLAGCAGPKGSGPMEELADTERVWVGMSKQAALKAWGEPDEINYMRTMEGGREQWVYGAAGRQRFLYFEDDRLVQIDY